MDKVELRPHHLLCLRFFLGRGYDDVFSARMAVLQRELREHPERMVLLAEGGDGLCAVCPRRAGNACSSPKPIRYDEAILRITDRRTGEAAPFAVWEKLIEERILKPGRLAEICADCEWWEICGPLSSPEAESVLQ